MGRVGFRDLLVGRGVPGIHILRFVPIEGNWFSLIEDENIHPTSDTASFHIPYYISIVHHSLKFFSKETFHRIELSAFELRIIRKNIVKIFEEFLSRLSMESFSL